MAFTKGSVPGSAEWDLLLLSACQRIVSRNLYPTTSLIRCERVSGNDPLIRKTRDELISSGQLVITAAAKASTRGSRTGPQTPKPSVLHPQSQSLPLPPPSPRLCATRSPKTDVRCERKQRYENRVSDEAVRDYFHAASRIRELLNK